MREKKKVDMDGEVPKEDQQLSNQDVSLYSIHTVLCDIGDGLIRKLQYQNCRRGKDTFTFSQ